MKKTLIALAVGNACICIAHANSDTALSTTLTTDDMGNTIYEAQMPTIHVTVSQPFSQQIGTQKLTTDDIKNRPTGNGNITELLKHNPNVQFDKDANLSSLGGELEPAKVSFHGEKFYNNNFMIDGLSNNNNIDPASNNATAEGIPAGNNAWDFPAGGEQSFWIDSSLIDSLEVFDSNISAKYGDFTGGVVDAKLKNPNNHRTSGQISYRTTRDEWTEFHIDPKWQDRFDKADFGYYQPYFTKNQYSASINQPLSDKASVLFSYNRQESTIPMYLIATEEWKNQKRLNETYILKGLYQMNNGDSITATAMYAPHSSSFFRRGSKDGGYKNQGGGYRLNLNWHHKANWGKVDSSFGYQKDENKITNEKDYHYTWWHTYDGNVSNYATWATSTGRRVPALEGGYGQFATDKHTITAKQDYALNPFMLGKSKHTLNLGWQYIHEKADYQRFKETALSGGGTNNKWDSSIVCDADDWGCITGEQYFTLRLLYPASARSVTTDKYALYAENNINLGRVELTPGVRASYNNWSKNFTIEPRFAFTIDAFNDERTRLFGGWNRYYANTLYAYQLKTKISQNHRQNRQLINGKLTDWVTASINERKSDQISANIDHLKTPFSDEITAGIAQKFGDTLWTLKWVNRHSKQSYARSAQKNANDEYEMTNDGWSKADTLTLSAQSTKAIEFDGLDLSWGVNAQWAKRKQNTSYTYDDNTADDDTRAIYENRLIYKDELPPNNFNQPWSIKANVNMSFPDIGFTWGHHLGYTAGYTGYTTYSRDCPAYDATICGDYIGKATLYEKRKFNDAITYDMRFAYEKPFGENQSITLTMDINNVFNKKTASSVGTSSGSQLHYKQGRNIWLGATYNW